MFRLAAVGLSLFVPFAALLAVDIYLHNKYMATSGFNVWGYRGPVVRSKQPNEWRLAVLGESTAFGYGVRWDEAFPAYLQNLLNAGEHSMGRPVTVVNLAYNNEGAYSFRFTLRDYDYLEYDAVLLYSGYNDLGDGNHHVFRHTSPIFRLTGYLPIFPVIFREKAMAIRYGGAIDAAYRGEKTTFRPNLAQRATASALETAARISRSLDQQLTQPMAESKNDAATREGVACGSRWAHYCGEIFQAVAMALDSGTNVLMVTQPYKRDLHIDQQTRLVEFLRQRFDGRRGLHFANLGHTIDTNDSSLAYDGLHLTAEGNRRVAAALAPYVRRLAE